MLNRNDLIIKLFLALYLVGIHVCMYLYACVYMCIMSMHVHSSVCVF